MTQIKALVIDDDETDRYIASRILTRSGTIANIEECSGGTAALNLIRDTSEFEKRLGPHPPPALILLDINMPRMSGFDVLQAISELRADDGADADPRYTLLMLTSSNHTGDRDEAMAFDFVADFIEKPLSQEKLQTILERHYPAIPAQPTAQQDR